MWSAIGGYLRAVLTTWWAIVIGLAGSAYGAITPFLPTPPPPVPGWVGFLVAGLGLAAAQLIVGVRQQRAARAASQGITVVGPTVNPTSGGVAVYGTGATINVNVYPPGAPDPGVPENKS